MTTSKRYLSVVVNLSRKEVGYRRKYLRPARSRKETPLSSKAQAPITRETPNSNHQHCKQLRPKLELEGWCFYGVWGLVIGAYQSGGEQLVDVVKRRDHFTASNELLKTVAADQLFVFQKERPEVSRNASRSELES
jgi:hypothetical protein